MNKAELVQSISQKAELTKAQASAAVDAFMSTTVEALKTGDGVSLKGFGSFAVQVRSARTGRNPKTGLEIAIGEKKIAKFKFSPEVRKELN
jgi:DNA-binding protein HU-beta